MRPSAPVRSPGTNAHDAEMDGFVRRAKRADRSVQPSATTRCQSPELLGDYPLRGASKCAIAPGTALEDCSPTKQSA